MSALQEFRNKYPQYNDMSDEDLANSLHDKYYSDIPKEEYFSKLGINVEQPKEKQKTIGEDVYDIINKAPEEVVETIGSIPGHTWKGLKQVVTNPTRSAINLGVGTGSTVKGLYNLIPHMLGYFAEHAGVKNARETAEKFKIPDLNVEKTLLGKPEEGDVFWQSLGGFGPVGKAVSKIPTGAGKVLSGGALYSGAHEQNPLAGAITGALLHSTGKVASIPFAKSARKKEAAQEVEEAKTLTEQQQHVVDQLVSELQKRYQAKTPEALETKRYKLQERMNELMPEANIPFERTENMLPASTGEHLLEATKKPIESSERNINVILGENLSHDERFTKALKEDQTKIIKSFKDQYDNLIDNVIKPLNISVPRPGVIEKIEHEVRNTLGSKLMLSDDQVKNLVDKISANDKQKNMSGVELYKEWKNIRDLGHDAMDKGRKAKISGERDEYFDVGKKLLGQAKKLLSLLDTHIGPENAKYLKELNNSYLKQVIEPRSNTVYNQAMGKKGLVTGNIIDKSKGIGSGTEHLRNRILNNPTLLNHALGQRFAGKPRELLNPNETESAFINKHPILPSLKERLTTALENETKAHKKAAQLSTEAKRVEKEWNEIKNKQSHAKEAQKNIEKINESIHKISFAIEKLEKELRNAELSKIELKEKEARLADLNNSLEKARDIVKNVSKFGAASVIGHKVASLLGKIFL